MKQTLTKTVASALSFAHLSSVRSKGARAEVDDDKPKDEDDEKAEGEDDKPKDEDKGAKGRADDGDDKPKDEDDEKAEGEDDKPKDEDKGAKGKAEDDEDSDEEMRGNSAAAAARRRERARCAAIFASAGAGKNPVLAANLAFKTSMSRNEAIALLEGSTAASAPAPAATGSRASRGNPNLGVPPAKSATKAQQAASSWDAALKAANPGRRG